MGRLMRRGRGGEGGTGRGGGLRGSFEEGRIGLSGWLVRWSSLPQWETWEKTWRFPLMRGRGGGGRGNEREDQLYQEETREGAPLEEEEAMILRGCLY